MKKKRKWNRRKNKNNLDLYLLELILMKKVMIFFFEIGKIKDYIAQSNKEAEIKKIKEKLEKEKETKMKGLK